ncbi:siphovirus Gp157 family protein [Pyruvatibacter sp.]|uniref:siphovirus Gp157 family protein n=1 Tax=Pyruvatibacter sp. TaxID=1981328 RepID=UPI0032EAFB5A
MQTVRKIDVDHAVAAFRTLRLKLAQEFPDADEETLSDTTEGISALPELVAQVIRSSLDDKSLASALKARIDEMSLRRTRLLTRADKKRELAADAMRETSLRKILEPDLTLSLRPCPPTVAVTDEQLVPEDYWIAQPAKLNRKDLRERVLSGLAVPGTQVIDQPDTLSVRTK